MAITQADLLLFKTAKSKQGHDNQQGGMGFEKTIHYREKRLSFVSIRSVGSRELFDIISKRKDGRILYLTVKQNGYLEPKERAKIEVFKQSIKSKIEQVYLVSSNGYTRL